jgi:hypothetical protein
MRTSEAVSPEFTQLYDACVRCIDALVAMDPAPDTPEGKLLLGLATAIEEFEKSEFGVPEVKP